MSVAVLLYFAHNMNKFVCVCLIVHAHACTSVYVCLNSRNIMIFGHTSVFWELSSIMHVVTHLLSHTGRVIFSVIQAEWSSQEIKSTQDSPNSQYSQTMKWFSEYLGCPVRPFMILVYPISTLLSFFVRVSQSSPLSQRASQEVFDMNRRGGKESGQLYGTIPLGLFNSLSTSIIVVMLMLQPWSKHCFFSGVPP